MSWIARNIQVNRVFVQKAAIDSRTVFVNSATNGIGSGQYNYFWLWYRIVTNLQRFSHVFGNWAGNHYSIGMPGRSNKFNPKAAHIELDIICCTQFPLTTVIAARTNLSQF